MRPVPAVLALLALALLGGCGEGALEYTIVDGRVYDARAMLDGVAEIVERAGEEDGGNR